MNENSERVAVALERIAAALEEQNRRAAVVPTRAAAPRAAPASNGGAVFPNYGKAKGQPIHGASLQDLNYYAEGCRRSLADQSKARWHDRERETLAAIEAELARQGGGDFGPPPSGAPSEEDVAF